MGSRGLSTLAPWRMAVNTHLKKRSKLGVKGGTCPLGLPPPLGERGGHPLNCTECVVAMISTEPKNTKNFLFSLKYPLDCLCLSTTKEPVPGDMYISFFDSQLIGGRAPDRDPRTYPECSTWSKAVLRSFLRFVAVNNVLFKKNYCQFIIDFRSGHHCFFEPPPGQQEHQRGEDHQSQVGKQDI